MGALPAQQEGVPTLRAALQSVAAAVLGPVQDGRAVAVLVPDGASETGRYAAAMLAFFLREGGAEAVVGATPRLPEELPERLGADSLITWRPRAARTVVLLQLRPAEGAYRLAAAVYTLESGKRLAVASAECRLDAGLAFLPTARRAELEPRDSRWLTLFGHIVPACGRSAGDFGQRMARAEGEHFFRRGMWEQAVGRLSQAADGEPCLSLVRLVFALHYAGRTEDALSRVEEALRLYAGNGPLYALKGWLLLRKGAPEDALMFLEQARLSDLAHEGYYWMARHLVAVEQGDAQTAERALLKAAELLPRVPYAQLEAARYYWRQARLQQAVRFYRAALEAGASSGDVWVELGMALDASGRREEALEAFRTACRKEPDNPAAARHLAAALAAAGRGEEAVRVLKEAAARRPDRVDMLIAYADAAARMWRTAEAEEAYRLAAARDPALPRAPVGIALMMLRRRRFAKAQELLAAVLASNPDCQPARVALGRVLAAQGRLAEGVAALQEAARYPGTEAAARLVLAELYRRAGQCEQAVHQAQIVVAARADAEAYAALARAFICAGQWEKAASAVKRALESDPRAARAHLAAAELAAARQRLDDALGEAERAVQLEPYWPEGLVLAGRLCLEAGRLEDCARYWSRAADLDRWDAELQWELAELLRTRLDRPREACRYYRRHVELRGAHAEEAMRLLGQLEASPAPGGGQ